MNPSVETFLQALFYYVVFGLFRNLYPEGFPALVL